jgi:hypothetical protein
VVIVQFYFDGAERFVRCLERFTAGWRSSLVRRRAPCPPPPWFALDGSQHAHACEHDRPTVFRRFDQHMDG